MCVSERSFSKRCPLSITRRQERQVFSVHETNTLNKNLHLIKCWMICVIGILFRWGGPVEYETSRRRDLNGIWMRFGRGARDLFFFSCRSRCRRLNETNLAHLSRNSRKWLRAFCCSTQYLILLNTSGEFVPFRSCFLLLCVSSYQKEKLNLPRSCWCLESKQTAAAAKVERNPRVHWTPAWFNRSTSAFHVCSPDLQIIVLSSGRYLGPSVIPDARSHTEVHTQPKQ